MYLEKYKALTNMEALYSYQKSSQTALAAAVTIENEAWVHTGSSCCCYAGEGGEYSVPFGNIVAKLCLSLKYTFTSLSNPSINYDLLARYPFETFSTVCVMQ